MNNDNRNVTKPIKMTHRTDKKIYIKNAGLYKHV